MVWLAAGNFKTHQKFIWETGNFSVGAASELRIFGGGRVMSPISEWITTNLTISSYENEYQDSTGTLI